MGLNSKTIPCPNTKIFSLAFNQNSTDSLKENPSHVAVAVLWSVWGGSQASVLGSPGDPGAQLRTSTAQRQGVTAQVPGRGRAICWAALARKPWGLSAQECHTLPAFSVNFEPFHTLW